MRVIASINQVIGVLQAAGWTIYVVIAQKIIITAYRGRKRQRVLGRVLRSHRATRWAKMR
jgi:hypothetical protein